MSIPHTRKRTICPTHPGEMLREDFMPDYGLSVAHLADSLGVSRQSVSQILHEKRAVSLQMAIRLARLFGNSPEFWLNAQRAVDLWEAEQALNPTIRGIRPLKPAAKPPGRPEDTRVSRSAFRTR